MEWNNKLCLQLIDEYQRHPALWNSKDGFYFSKNKKQDAWDAIALKLNVDVAEARQKMNSLLGSFRREKSRIRRSIKAATDTDKAYVSKWFAFKRLNFLMYRDEPIETVDAYGLQIHPKEEDVETGVEIFLNEDSHFESNLFQPHEGTDDLNISGDHPFSSSPPQLKKRIKKSSPIEDTRIKDAINILESVVSVPNDSCSSFGKYIGEKLRQYNSKTRAIVQHSINNIIFEADMGKFEEIPQIYPPPFLNSSPSLSPPALSPSNSINSPLHPGSPSLDM